jgi:hypothetical protein
MKKISQLIISLILLISTTTCSGYKPVFNSSNLEFNVADYSITGNKKVGKQIYKKLENLTKLNKNNSKAKNIIISINTSNSKNSTSKDKAGKILGYKISLSVKFIAKDLQTNMEIINETFSISINYSVQKQNLETVKLEKVAMESLVDKVYEKIFSQLSSNL